jgi:mono/diheme cytochrome c family protein
MSMLRGVAFTATLLLTHSSFAETAMPPKPNPEKGRALAERVCATCHVISKTADSPLAADVPSFYAIANKPGQSMEMIAGRIVIPHPPMPAVALTREEIINVVTYIMTFQAVSGSSP